MTQPLDEEEDTPSRGPTRSINIRVENDMLDTAKRIGDFVGLGYQTVLKAAARVGLRQFVKAHRIELDIPEDIPLPGAPTQDFVPIVDEEDEEDVGRPGPDEVIVHDRPLPRLRP